MAQVVEAQRPQPGRVTRALEAPPQSRPVEVLPTPPDEHEIVQPAPTLAGAQPRERLRGLLDERHHPPVP